MLEVLNPATEEVVDRLEPATEGRRRRSHRPRESCLPKWRDVEPRTARASSAPSRRRPGRREGEPGATGVEEHSASPSATRAARWGWSSRPSTTTPGCQSAFSATASPSPAAWTSRSASPGRRRAHRPVELPAHHSELEDGPRSGRREHLVLKPAELTPLTAVEFERIARTPASPRAS